ncbi:uncharacterized protein I206_102710 [Kwoniella pini CBS 10737]|uniref:N-acetyltransferase ESCO acetyl-transferase domain-containing protein n=1 Tax=Kwoniella pini CBS 10737 TaxID=1296096 RepID=A0A1B9I649_9TREE|nr:uncharacterized protein I206_03064 [Kwoniella pini CBS 10737]OCF51000.1 hypothetical protein I206_03064 [Kwoniella pini CBS 10737]
MSFKPAIRRTYGKAPPRTTSSSSLFDSPSPPPFQSSDVRSSSPPSSSRIETPGPSSPQTPRKRVLSRSSSPLFWSADEEEEEDETKIASSTKSPIHTSNEGNGRTIKKMPSSQPKKAIQSSLKGFFTFQPQRKVKTPLEPSKTIPVTSNSSKIQNPVSVLGVKEPWNSKAKTTNKPLTQLHLTHLPLLHTCSECGMSFMRGGEDESIHIDHHTRVLRGITWDGLGKSKVDEKGWKIVKDDINFGLNGKGKGKIIMVDGSIGGNKLDEILSTVDRVLSSPPLPPTIIERCKIFLFVTSSPPLPSKLSNKRQKLDTSISKKVVQKERVIGVVVAQGIKWAMRVLKVNDQSDLNTKLSTEDKEDKEKTILIESGGLGSVTCDPESLSTPLGIHRLYISPLYRSNKLSFELLESASKNTIYGCKFDPLKGEIAFSQPTQSGRTIMEKWGKGNIRVFVDDESQL